MEQRLVTMCSRYDNKIGLVLKGTESDSRIIPERDAIIIAHDLLEHVDGMGEYGDEIIAFGAGRMYRPRHFDYDVLCMLPVSLKYAYRLDIGNGYGIEIPDHIETGESKLFALVTKKLVSEHGDWYAHIGDCLNYGYACVHERFNGKLYLAERFFANMVSALRAGIPYDGLEIGQEYKVSYDYVDIEIEQVA
jgi:hypothetical protein